MFHIVNNYTWIIVKHHTGIMDKDYIYDCKMFFWVFWYQSPDPEHNAESCPS